MERLDTDVFAVQAQGSDRAFENVIPVSGIFAIREGRDLEGQADQLLGFQFGQDNGWSPAGSEEQNHRSFHQVKMQAGEMRQRRTRVQGNRIQARVPERSGEFIETGSRHSALQANLPVAKRRVIRAWAKVKKPRSGGLGDELRKFRPLEFGAVPPITPGG
jgi:hypothetical protein